MEETNRFGLQFEMQADFFGCVGGKSIRVADEVAKSFSYKIVTPGTIEGAGATTYTLPPGSSRVGLIFDLPDEIIAEYDYLNVIVKMNRARISEGVRERLLSTMKPIDEDIGSIDVTIDMKLVLSLIRSGIDLENRPKCLL